MEVDESIQIGSNNLDLVVILETILKVMDECIQKNGPIPKTVLNLKVRDQLQSVKIFVDGWTISSVIDLLAYEGKIIIDEGARGKQFCLLPKLRKPKHITI